MEAIIAVNLVNYIGKEDNLPFYSPEDLKHFKKLTSEGSGAVIVGFNTAKTLPPLKGRIIHIINTRDGNWYEELLEFIKQYPDAKIIGGKKTYEKLLHLITKVHISLIEDVSKGDTISPDFFSILNHKPEIVRYNFQGVPNFGFMDKFVVIAKNKNVPFTLSCKVFEDESYLLIDSTATKFKLNLYKPLNLQPKETKDFMYKFITDKNFYNESSTKP